MGEEKQAANLQVGNKTDQIAENRKVDFNVPFTGVFPYSLLFLYGKRQDNRTTSLLAILSALVFFSTT